MQALEARRSERMWRERMEAFNQAIEQQKEDTLDITGPGLWTDAKQPRALL
jgi:hypothetical protein